MLLSMTGYAAKELIITVDQAKVGIIMSLKSLNSRFFESVTKFPPQLNHLETKITKHLKKKLHRGRVYVTILIDHEDAFKSEINASLPVIKKYLQAVNDIQKSFEFKETLSLPDLIKLPHVFNVEEKTLDTESEKKVIEAVGDLADDLIKMQKEEGQSILTDMEKRMASLEKEISSIKEQSKINIENHKISFDKELHKIETKNSELADTKQAILYALLDKIDIHEETVLFKSYLEQMKKILSDDTTVEKGKKLSFTLQELNREINTISAKCSDVEIGRIAITIKVELEKMREQAQNIL